MRAVYGVVAGVSLLLGYASGLFGQAIGIPQRLYVPVATVHDIMEAMLEPATEVIFDAVSPIHLADGSLEKVPVDETEWAAVRASALLMSEAANLLMMEGRRIDGVPAAGVLNARAQAPIERAESMPQIAQRVSTSRQKWNGLAADLVAAGVVTLHAVDARDPKALLRADDVIDARCEACHREYWYPR